MVTDHAFERGRQRHSLGHVTVEAIAESVRSGKGVFVETRKGLEFWIVRANAKDIPVIWNPETLALITILPRHALKHLKRTLKDTIHEAGVGGKHS